jgi:type II secretory pathway component PulF
MVSILAQTMSDQDAANAFAAFGAFFGFIALAAIAVTVLSVWMFWRIFDKAGYNGAMGLLVLIPSVGFIICIAILAFSTWPNERATQIGWTPPPPGTGPPPGPPAMF